MKNYREDIKKEQLTLSISNQKTLNALRDNFLFLDRKGEKVFSGDIVSFRRGDDCFDTCGYIDNRDGLQIACFDQVFLKWTYHRVIE